MQGGILYCTITGLWHPTPAAVVFALLAPRGLPIPKSGWVVVQSPGLRGGGNPGMVILWGGSSMFLSHSSPQCAPPLNFFSFFSALETQDLHLLNPFIRDL
ncbi:unnamed protein product [Tuber melanosporum]|uniref:(Perigord truffle) hypothetical protein n=1 Tax=Tuber melanosporum (strain Mel28) TaxID=656061 RepID=D5G9E3_TUBMM|nr:uncharacterized protein GSTUM_00003269001 [Tuber melanosporum]CAZ81136.1 unnamed protein product [Tuber melanosporum]